MRERGVKQFSYEGPVVGNLSVEFFPSAPERTEQPEMSEEERAKAAKVAENRRKYGSA